MRKANYSPNPSKNYVTWQWVVKSYQASWYDKKQEQADQLYEVPVATSFNEPKSGRILVTLFCENLGRFENFKKIRWMKGEVFMKFWTKCLAYFVRILCKINEIFPTTNNKQYSELSIIEPRWFEILHNSNFASIHLKLKLMLVHCTYEMLCKISKKLNRNFEGKGKFKRNLKKF